MTKRLDSKIGEQDYNGLLASNVPTPLVATVEVKKHAADTIPAGTVLVKGSDGKCAPCAAALDGDSIVFVLSEDIEAGTGTEVTMAYKTGNFVRSRLVAGGVPSGEGAVAYMLTEKDYDYLRQAGILSEDVID